MENQNFRCLLLALVLVVASPLWTNTASGQESKSDFVSREVELLTKLFDDYDAHYAKFTDIESTYKKNQDEIRLTEAAVQQIQSLGYQKQVEAMRASAYADNIGDALWAAQNNNNGNNGGGNNGGNNNGNNNNGNNNGQGNRGIDQFTAWQLRRQQNMANYEAFMKSQEVSKLSVELQNTLRKRMSAMQQGMQIQQTYYDWYQEHLKFNELFWEFFDLDGHRANSENRQILEVVSNRGSNHAFAQLLKGLTAMRLGLNAEAMTSLEKAQELDPQLIHIASAARAIVHLQLDEKKKSKQEMQVAIKGDRANPKVKWLRAIWAANQRDNAEAMQELEGLAKDAKYELPATRLQILVIAQKAKKGKKDPDKMLEDAEKALGLSGSEDWLSHFVSGIAYRYTGDEAAAQKSFEAAAGLALESNQGLCKKFIDGRGDPDKLEWNFASRP